MPVTLNSADQFLGFAISMAAMQCSKKPFMNDSGFILGLRIAFGLSVILQMAVALYIKRQIVTMNDKTTFKYRSEPSLFNTTEGEEIEISNCEYDLNEVNKIFRTCLLQSLIITLVHIKWSVTQPILIQSTTFFRNLVFSPLYRAHLYGMKIIRPFDKNMLFAAQESPAPAVDAAVAEKKKKKED